MHPDTDNADDDDIIDAVIEEPAQDVGGQPSAVSESGDAAAPPEPPPAGPLCPERLRDLGELAEVIRCDRRPPILFALADPAQGGPANVGAIAGRTGIDAGALSHHLGKLKDLGLLWLDRRSKEHWYAVVADRVRFRQQPPEATLRLTGRLTGVAVTISLPPTPPPPPPPPERGPARPGGGLATDGAPMNTDARTATSPASA